MRRERTRSTRGGHRAVLGAFAAVLLASCSTSGDDVPFGLSTVTTTPAAPVTADFAQSTTDFSQATTNTIPAAAPAYVVEEGDPELPVDVAASPTLRPGSEQVAVTADAVPAAIESADAQSAVATEPTAPAALESASVPGEQPSVAPPATTAEAQPQPAQFIENSHAAPQLAAMEPPKKRGFLSSFFGTQARAATAEQAPRPVIASAQTPRPLVAGAGAGQQPSSDPAPLVRLAATTPGGAPPAGTSALPGVRQNSLFEISRRSGSDDDSDIDLHEGDDGEFQVASAAGLARLAPNGLMQQTEHVDVACLKPSLVRTLKAVESHYGRKVVVTSGYRNVERNRKARGARNSLHMYCAAADIQVAGVDKWQLAEYLRTMPGRGGVGTYCHTNSVHIDVGPERDWNWRCRRRK